jgi:hypothetical protein
LIHEGRVIVNRDHITGSSILAFDSKTGKKLWETARPDRVTSYGTPIVWRQGEITDIVVAGAQFGRVRALLNERNEQLTEAGPATPVEIRSVAPPPVRGVRRPPGRAVVNCVIRTDQRLGDCRIVEESPSGFGYGDQALRAMAFFRYRPPMTASGRPVEGQRVTTFVNMGR